MKQVKCVITDDEPTACEGLQRYVEKVDFLSLMGVCEDTMQLNINGNIIKIVLYIFELQQYTKQ